MFAAVHTFECKQGKKFELVMLWNELVLGQVKRPTGINIALFCQPNLVKLIFSIKTLLSSFLFENNYHHIMQHALMGDDQRRATPHINTHILKVHFQGTLCGDAICT